MSDILDDENVKEMMDWVAFRDDISKHNQIIIMKDLKSMYPDLYQEWYWDNKELIEKWNIPVDQDL